MERFDPDSGLVYKETIVKQPKVSNWLKNSGGRLALYKAPEQGAESLYAKAMRAIIVNADALTTEALRTTPTSIVRQIWKDVQRECVMGVTAASKLLLRLTLT